MKINPDDVFIYPTDTVWGIGCALTSSIGHSKIADIKGTAKNKPLSVMFASVQDVFDSFHFAEEVSLEWLSQYFEMETTLGLPLKTSKLKIPKYATGDSDFVSIRVLHDPLIKEIYSELNSPFFTTSLNLTGDPPITTLQDAKKFHAEHATDALFFGENSALSLSGQSSTIVFLRDNLDFEIKREGRNIEAVKNHLIKLFQS